MGPNRVLRRPTYLHLVRLSCLFASEIGLFNEASGTRCSVASLRDWQPDSAFFPFPFFCHFSSMSPKVTLSPRGN
ncbi:unnamed protein product [Protopolystoma xenopodis]|uniref:Uncharacterized protein n=1 Tax=Protopolystoma xenopodis TaxID=117903 RepID=A0A3S5CCT5_9PLAT|nr:unnamed protein product [Protopolystoma xenopodis]